MKLAYTGFAVCVLAAIGWETRPWWMREIRGSVYLDRRNFGPEKRYDLATVSEAEVLGKRDPENGRFEIALYVRTPDDSVRRWISLPLNGREPPSRQTAGGREPGSQPAWLRTNVLTEKAIGL